MAWVTVNVKHHIEAGDWTKGITVTWEKYDDGMTGRSVKKKGKFTHVPAGTDDWDVVKTDLDALVASDEGLTS